MDDLSPKEQEYAKELMKLAPIQQMEFLYRYSLILLPLIIDEHAKEIDELGTDIYAPLLLSVFRAIDSLAYLVSVTRTYTQDGMKKTRKAITIAITIAIDRASDRAIDRAIARASDIARAIDELLLKEIDVLITQGQNTIKPPPLQEMLGYISCVLERERCRILGNAFLEYHRKPF